MTHDELVDRAARWLKNNRKCCIVLTELLAGFSSEIPDAIGWKYGQRSVLIECKVSRADFLRDRKKLARQAGELAIGAKRYYMAPAGLIAPEEVPENWGLLEVEGRSVKITKEPANEDQRGEWGLRREIALLVSALRRIEPMLDPPDICACICRTLADKRARPPATLDDQPADCGTEAA